MTLAIGMLCENGLLLVADTRLSYADGSVAEAVKLKAFEAGDGVFAIVQSSDDFHAAESLVAELKEKLKGTPPKSRLDFIARVFTDPIYATWFDNGPVPSPHTVLCQASYMMHKAKQLHPSRDRFR